MSFFAVTFGLPVVIFCWVTIMEKIVRGIHHFQTTTFSAHRELFESLSHGQQPETLLITCSDSRIAPDLLMQTQPGDSSYLRNAGNLIPPYGAANGGEGATIEYAVAALGVPHALSNGSFELRRDERAARSRIARQICRWSANGSDMPTRRGRWWTNVIPISKAFDLLNATIKENVLVQLDNLRTIRRSRRLWRKAR